ncbi:MAG: LysR family transcriptional regulator, partial [Firmicutes bacterium]|nr:LysR family transcriptional regulator [Bacillota bacterium]
MTIQQIRCFVTVASCGSINKAASLLFVSQPNLSTTIRSLEKELGYQLLNRTRNGVELTAEGAIFLSHAREVLLQFDQLSLMEQLLDEPQTLSVATMAHCHVSEALALLKQDFLSFPKKCQIRTGVRDEVVENVTSGNYRLGILYIYDIFKSQFVASLSAKRLSVHSLGPCHTEVLVGTASPHYASSQKVIEAEQLSRHTYVTYTAKEYVPLVRIGRLTGLD